MSRGRAHIKAGKQPVDTVHAERGACENREKLPLRDQLSDIAPGDFPAVHVGVEELLVTERDGFRGVRVDCRTVLTASCRGAFCVERTPALL